MVPRQVQCGGTVAGYEYLAPSHTADNFLAISRPRCTIQDCSNLGEYYKTFGTKKYYRKYCSSHKHQVYSMAKPKRSYFYEKMKRIKKNICSKCFVSTNTHLHRIIPGCEGGLYKLGNVLELCSTCHYETHRIAA